MKEISRKVLKLLPVFLIFTGITTFTKVPVLAQEIKNSLSGTSGNNKHAMVNALLSLPQHICKWTFDDSSVIQDGTSVKVKDKTTSAYTGTLMNEAVIRTIGNTNRYNVLYLGNGSGYFDMGAEIGSAIYSLNDYTICTYFRVDDSYSEIGSAGNFIWTFSNTQDAMTDKNGYVIGHLNNQSHEISTSYYSSGNQGVSVGSPAAKGAWHHFAYVQKSDTGFIYVDGALLKKTSGITNKPSSIALVGRNGTLYNWIGRSNYTSDVYLRKTLIYDFNVFSKALSANDLTTNYAVQDTIALLNSAYAANPDYRSPELLSEYNNLSLGDITALKANINLPIQGSTYPDVKIQWTSTKPEIISTSGIVNRPDYFDYNVTLTAKLSFGIYTLSRSFSVKVIANEGTPFTNDLVVRFDFSNLDGSIVKDVAEKQFAGTLKNSAKVVTMGTPQTGIYNVLNLQADSGYFDMGAEVGKVISRLNNYSIGVYYRIDPTYSGLGNSGNYIWNFSNSNNVLADQNGYIAASLQQQSISSTPKYYTAASGNQSISFSRPALKGSWHHLTYTQAGNTGIMYIDGVSMISASITNLPSITIMKEGLLGTINNWIGRSCYASDAYLKNTLVYDFRLYKRTLLPSEIQRTQIKVTETLAYLNAAYNSYIGAEKTAETAAVEKTVLPKPSFFEVINNDSSSARFNISDFKRMIFSDSTTSIYLISGSASNFTNSDIQKIVFGTETTGTVPIQNTKPIRIYPNPASEYICINQADIKSGMVCIYSVTGKLLLKQSFNSSTLKININQLPQGMYIVKTGNQVVKFTKK